MNELEDSLQSFSGSSEIVQVRGMKSNVGQEKSVYINAKCKFLQVFQSNVISISN